jgi:hypothetical protein
MRGTSTALEGRGVLLGRTSASACRSKRCADDMGGAAALISNSKQVLALVLLGVLHECRGGGG